jgi:hypothetical protein
MSQSTVLKSLAELGDFFDLPESMPEVAEADVGAMRLNASEAFPLPVPELAELLAQLEVASATLATVARQDQETRAVALRDLERYDAAVAAQAEADDALRRATMLREQAEAFAATAFAEEARAASRNVVGLASRAEEAARHLVAERDREVARLAAQLDLVKLLAERRREEEAEHTRAAEAERARRLSEGLARARSALESSRLEEAKALLGPLAKVNPDNTEVASLWDIIARRELTVKVNAAENAIRAARREYRHDPVASVARLTALEIDGLPDALARQVFGEWARACTRICRDRMLVDPLRYAPDPGRGAVLAREREGAPYTVVSALGMDALWQPGNAVPERLLRRARPLR